MPVQQIAVSTGLTTRMEGGAGAGIGLEGVAKGGPAGDTPTGQHTVPDGQQHIDLRGETEPELVDMVGETETDVDKCDTETQNSGDGVGGVDDTTDAAPEQHVLVDAVIVTDRPCDPTDLSDPQAQPPDVDVVNPGSRDSDTQSPAKGDTTSSGRQTEKRSSTRLGKSAKKEKPTPFKKKDSIAKETLHPNSPTPMSTERCDSSLSNSSMDVCRICQCDTCEILNDSPLVAPCLCAGSLRYVHQACLQKWIKSSDKMSCELCQYEYMMTKKTKPFREWERLDMTPAERRKVVCSVTFHVIAITCVVWSLYVLIDRTTEEVEAGSLLWPFWTKLIVVAIGFTGGVVFMYVQCKMYLTLCKKWRMYNKVIIINNISEMQRERAMRECQARRNEKEAQLESGGGGGPVTNFDVFNIVNETDSV